MKNKKKTLSLTEAEMRKLGTAYHEKLERKRMTNKEIREKLEIGWDKVIIKRKDSRDGVIHKGDVYVDRGYFYSHGMTPSKLVDKVLGIFPEAKIIEKCDHWAPWPKRSYMHVTFRLPEEAK